MNFRGLLFISLICFPACALVSNPEKSGGEIIAIPEGPWCEFYLSPDGNWLSYIGDYHPENSGQDFQRQTVFVELSTGEAHHPELNNELNQLIADGLGPDGNACFSDDNRTAYISSSVVVPRTERERDRAELQQDGGVAFSVPGYRPERNRFKVDLTSKPLQMVRTDEVKCTEPQNPVPPPIRIEQQGGNLIQLYNSENNLIAEHKPRGRINRGISMVELSRSSWHRYYAVSPDQTQLAYQVFESGPLFSSPTHGYMVDLQEGSAKFLAASVYSFSWDPIGNLYACTSHSNHNNVIARWKPN